MMEGVRDSIRRHSTATIAIMAVVVAGALFFTLRNASSSTSSMTPVMDKVYCTSDDGQTTFVGSMTNVPPFQHEGKTACRAWVFSCDGGKTRFVGYLERFTPDAKKRIESAKPSSGPGAPVGPGDSEIKKPGPGNPWVSRANFAAAAKVQEVVCPPGQSGEPTMVLP